MKLAVSVIRLSFFVTVGATICADPREHDLNHKEQQILSQSARCALSSVVVNYCGQNANTYAHARKYIWKEILNTVLWWSFANWWEPRNAQMCLHQLSPRPPSERRIILYVYDVLHGDYRTLTTGAQIGLPLACLSRWNLNSQDMGHSSYLWFHSWITSAGPQAMAWVGMSQINPIWLTLVSW